MEAHKSFKTSDRLAPLAIISSVRFSAAKRDSACDGVLAFATCLDSGPVGRSTPAASTTCILWSGLSRDSGELITFSILGPVYDPCVINIRFRSGARHLSAVAFDDRGLRRQIHTKIGHADRAMMDWLVASCDFYRITEASSKFSRALRGWSLLESP